VFDLLTFVKVSTLALGDGMDGDGEEVVPVPVTYNGSKGSR
jgi:hypothetical protein